eukprot:scaffold358_cov256-Pinguiococcus_pyrenoidosus.AAC.32
MSPAVWPLRMGTWSVRIDAQLLVEAALVVLASTLWFLCFVHRDMFEVVIDDTACRRTEAPHDRFKEALEERLASIDIDERLHGSSLDSVLDEIYKLMNVDRTLAAGELLHALERKLLSLPSGEQVEAFRERMQRDLVKISKIHNKFESALLAVTEFADDAGIWTPTGRVESCETFRKTDQRGNLYVKVDATLQGDPLHCLALWREGHLYHEWLPWCTSSRFVEEIGRAEGIVGFELSFCRHVLGAEVFVHGFGVENLCEGQFIILGEGVEHWPPGSREPIKRLDGAGYVTIRPKLANVKICVEVLSTTAVRHSMIMSIRGNWKAVDLLRQSVLAKILSGTTAALQGRMDRMRDRSTSCSHLDLICAPRSMYTRWLQPLLIHSIESRAPENDGRKAVNEGASDGSAPSSSLVQGNRRASKRRSLVLAHLSPLRLSRKDAAAGKASQKVPARRHSAV